MVSIIKNQLLKHLSRFTKNLSADKINLSTFKGEGELSNLELNEIVLTDLLELPSWLRLTSAWCNKVTFRIQWTKLKNVPICLSLDEVNIIVETCEELRSMSAQGSLASYTTAPGKYSFIHKVIDGITVSVNTVHVTFNSPAFTANVQISRILVQSKSPEWKKTDLRVTRIKEPERGEVLIFKELEWQTVRIEAKSTIDQNLTPLRLLTNQARCRITIKKRLADSFIMGSKLVVILDDLLWVLTDSQLKAALHFLDSLAGLVQKATNITRKVKAARKLEELPEYRAQLSQQVKVRENDSAISKLFSRFDVVETSYHFLSHQIILHLCDDPGDGRSSHPNLKDGGALQINIQKFQMDYYPYHLARRDRKHWPKYKEASIPHPQWQEQSLSAFKSKIIDLFDKNKFQHTPLMRANKGAADTSPQSDQPRKPQSPNHNIKTFVSSQFAKLMTSCIVMRIEDFMFYKVTTSNKKQALKEFISGDRARMSLKDSTSIVHAEFTYFYYPDDTPFPLPPPKFYVQLYPIQITFDVDSCLWFNSFALNLHQSLLASKPQVPVSNFTYIDVKIESILPKVNFESAVEFHTQKDRPKCLSFQVTRVTITNVRNLDQSSRADLAKCVDSFHMGSLFFGTEFPSEPNDFYIVTQKFLDHISAEDNIRTVPKELDMTSINALGVRIFTPFLLQLAQMSKDMLWTEAKDVWCVNLDPVWGDFVGARAVGSNKPVPFLDTVPVTIWLHANMDPNSTIKQESSNTNNADIHALAYISNLVSLQINHYQYLFLLRLAEEAAELATFLSIDSNRIMKVENSGSLAIGALIPQLEVTFVMPSQNPGKESSGGDESFVPDSSSIPDDILVGGSAATIWQHSTLSMEKERKIIPNGAGTPISEISSSFSLDFVQHTSDAKPLAKNAAQPFSNIPNNFNAGLNSMKKGFSSLMTSIDTALKSSPDDVSDAVSIRSDASSDCDTFEIINVTTDDPNTADMMFRVPEFQNENKGIVEVASEVIEDQEESIITTASDPSLSSSCKRKDLVSVSTFKLNKVEFLQQSVGYSSSIKVQVGNILCDDCSSIPWDEFQKKFSSRSRAWTDNPSQSTSQAKVKLRLDHDLILPSSKSMLELNFTERENMKKLFKDRLVICMNDLNLDVSMSTATGLADLAEDEIIAPPIPLEITLDNIYLNLIEDRPPVNITSPGPVPVNLKILNLYITRSEDGVFNIIPQKPALVASSSALSNIEAENLQNMKQLRVENDELRRRLLAFERVSQENLTLRRSKEESDMLRSCLSSSQEEVSRLLDEKRRLLDEIKKLQDQLLPDRSRQWTTKR